MSRRYSETVSKPPSSKVRAQIDRKAERCRWRFIADLVAETVGFKTPMYDAAIDAMEREEGAVDRFYDLFEETDFDTRMNLLQRMQHYESNPKKVAAYAKKAWKEGRI